MKNGRLMMIMMDHDHDEKEKDWYADDDDKVG
jgi:hypothetical protein